MDDERWDVLEKRIAALEARVADGADLRDLPPATLVLAEIDPLRSGGEVLAERLRAFGTPVEARTYPGVTHEFFGMGAVLADARAAQGFANTRLRAALSPAPPEPRRRARRRGAS